MPGSEVIERLRLPDGREIDWTLTRKRVKNINLRVRSDGTVAVSASPRVPEREIERFLQSRAGWILSALDRYAKRLKNAPRPLRFAEGETLRVFGRDLPVHVERGRGICGACRQNSLFLTVKDPADEAQRRAAAEDWAKETLAEKVNALCRAAALDFAIFHIPRATVRFRRMTSRWGSCNTKTAVLTFNYALISAPPAAVEYVVYHEFAHLIHPDHSPAFYATVARFLPDWKARRAMLKEIPCRLF